MFILYGLYFDGNIDGVDNDEHVGHFNAFSSEHFQYLAFSFDGGGLGGLGDKVRLLLDQFSAYIFFYSVHVLSLVTEAYDWMKKILYTIYA